MKFLALLLATINLIPAPMECISKDGYFQVPRELTYSVTTGKILECQMSVADFEDFLTSSSCWKGAVPVKNKPSLKVSVGTRFYKGATEWGTQEGYELTVEAKGIAIRAATPQGAFYATQTLCQLLDGDKIPCCVIKDEPSYSYRGLMVDVSRHFFSVDCIVKQLDAMALLKMNRFHFHLVDGQGWRLELDSHPELVRQTAFREELMYGHPTHFINVPDGYVPGTVWDEPGCYGGYYSKEQIRQIVEYARKRGIDVIPEIEMPGHSTELYAVHPELFCTEIHKKSSICPGKEETFSFFAEIVSEVMDLFPSKYIHIGGDEAAKDNWRDCVDCQSRMRQENLKSVEELQSWFIGRMDRFVAAKGRHIIGWDEIMQGGLTQGATVMSWNGVEQGSEAMEMGHDVIMSPTKFCYLDYYQSAQQFEPMAIGGYVPLSKTYSFPMPESSHLLGIQGNLWTEYIVTQQHLEYMLYPRSFAIAELGWSPNEKRKDFEDFRQRALLLGEKMSEMGYTVFDLRQERPIDDSQGVQEIVSLANGKKCSLTLLDSGRTKKVGKSLTNGRNTGTVGALRFSEKAELVVDLETAQEIHVISPYFLRHNIDKSAALPSLVTFQVSSDGVDFRTIGTARPMLDDATLTWAIVPVNLFCREKEVRYIKLVVTPSETCLNLATHRETNISWDAHVGSGRFQQVGLTPEDYCKTIVMTEIVVN